MIKINIFLSAMLLVTSAAQAMDEKPVKPVQLSSIVDTITTGDCLLSTVPSDLIPIIKFYEPCVWRFDDEATAHLKDVLRRNDKSEIDACLKNLNPRTCLYSGGIKKSQPLLVSDSGLSVLDIAILNDNADAEDALIDLGACSFQCYDDYDDDEVRAKNKDRVTTDLMLHLLAENGYGDIIVWYLSRNPSVDVNFVMTKKSLLDWSVIHRDEATTSYLLGEEAHLYSVSQDELIATFPGMFFCKPKKEVRTDFDLVATRNKYPSLTSRMKILPINNQSSADHVAIWGATVTKDARVAEKIAEADCGLMAMKKFAADDWVKMLGDIWSLEYEKALVDALMLK